MQTLTPELHRRFVRQARRISADFATRLRRIGPIGYQSTRRDDLGTHLARIVVGQQLSTLAAKSIWARVEAAAADAPRTLDFFVESKVEVLRGCGLSMAKTRALLDLKRAADEGLLGARRMTRATPEARRETLLNLRGIGPWTVDMVSMFYFREPDVWPLGDLAVRKTFVSLLGGHPGYDVHTGAELFAPYRSFLALYMWRIANDGPEE
jgi:DNA-3-methyladenine glycosylase II